MREPETSTAKSLNQTILKLNARAWGIAFGLILGLGLCLATTMLVVRGGDNVGQHLGLLANYFPGYRVTPVGAIVGFVYGFVTGYGIGRIIGAVYNRVASR